MDPAKIPRGLFLAVTLLCMVPEEVKYAKANSGLTVGVIGAIVLLQGIWRIYTFFTGV